VQRRRPETGRRFSAWSTSPTPCGTAKIATASTIDFARILGNRNSSDAFAESPAALVPASDALASGRSLVAGTAPRRLAACPDGRSRDQVGNHTSGSGDRRLDPVARSSRRVETAIAARGATRKASGGSSARARAAAARIERTGTVARGQVVGGTNCQVAGTLASARGSQLCGDQSGRPATFRSTARGVGYCRSGPDAAPGRVGIRRPQFSPPGWFDLGTAARDADCLPMFESRIRLGGARTGSPPIQDTGPHVADDRPGPVFPGLWTLGTGIGTLAVYAPSEIKIGRRPAVVDDHQRTAGEQRLDAPGVRQLD
jgi:hypothetical protein